MSAPPGLSIPWERIVDELRRVADGLLRVEGRLDTLASADQQANERHHDHEERLRVLETTTTGVGDHGKRLSNLERWMWVAIGVSVVLGAIGGGLAGSLLH